MLCVCERASERERRERERERERERLNYIRECSKLEKKYKGRDDWVDKMIHLELIKRPKFDDTRNGISGCIMKKKRHKILGF